MSYNKNMDVHKNIKFQIIDWYTQDISPCIEDSNDSDSSDDEPKFKEDNSE